MGVFGVLGVLPPPPGVFGVLGVFGVFGVLSATMIWGAGAAVATAGRATPPARVIEMAEASRILREIFIIGFLHSRMRRLLKSIRCRLRYPTSGGGIPR